VRRRAFPAPAVVAVLAVAVLAARPASATDAEVTSDSAAQAYDLRSPTGETLLSRRRFTSMLGVGVYDLFDLHRAAEPGDPAVPEINFKARLRYDADYGISGGTTDPRNPSALVPGVAQSNVDLMYGYIEGRRFLRGWLGFKLGRQYVTDALGWWSFDGGQVSVTTPWFVKAEIYGGLEQRGGLALSSSRFESDGVWRGNRQSYDPSLYPQFQPAAIAPAYGAALESTGVTWLHARLTYRRVYDTGASNTTEFASGLVSPAVYDGTRISSDRLGYAIEANLHDYGGVKAGIVYDFYNDEATQGYATVDGTIGKKVTVSADYDYYVPTFDADSIWNFFAGEPMNDVGLRANVDLTDHLSFAGGGKLRVYSVQTAPQAPGNGSSYSPYPNYAPGLDLFPGNGHPFDEGGNLSARYRTGATLVSLRGAGNWGDEGDRVGADIAAQHVFESRYVTSVRTGVWQWDDKLRPDRDATSFSYVLGMGYRFAPRCSTLFEFEHDMNRLVGQRIRLMLMLSLAVGP
jgi:hypothetical protein